MRWRASGQNREKMIAFGAVTDGADVVDQGIEPDIGDVFVSKGNFNPPAQSLLGPRDAEILQRIPKKTQNLIPTRPGQDESLASFDVFDQPGLILAHPEKNSCSPRSPSPVEGNPDIFLPPDPSRSRTAHRGRNTILHNWPGRFLPDGKDPGGPVEPLSCDDPRWCG